MMKQCALYFLAIIFCFSISTVFGQDTVEESEPQSSIKEDDYYSSSIGISILKNAYYGDLNPAFRAPFDGRMGVSIFLKSNINPYLFTKFNFDFKELNNANPKVGQEIFFRSSLYSLSASINYNFKNLIKKEHPSILPYIGVGLEVISFNTKLDLYDRNKQRYNLWSDGSYRNIAENEPNANDAEIIHRDYTFETEARDLNTRNGYRYDPFTLAVPITFGVTLNLSHRVAFDVGLNYYYLFTDIIDNTTNKDINNLSQGSSFDPNNDFILSGFLSLSYKLGFKKDYKVHNKQSRNGAGLSKIDFDINSLDTKLSEKDISFLQGEDSDEDGISDLIDECPDTPENIKVNEKGCPKDTDLDGVFDYEDEEINSPKGATVDEKGVTINVKNLELLYLQASDSTGQYAEVDKKEISSNTKSVKRNLPKTFYTVATTDIKEYDVPFFLNTKKIYMFKPKDDVQGYFFGRYSSIKNALTKRIKLVKRGYKALKIIKYTDGKYKDITNDVNLNSVPLNATSIESNNLTIRIELGSFKNRINPEEVFKGLDIIEVAEKNNTKYSYFLTSTFFNWSLAAKEKINLTLKGFKNVKIRAFERDKELNYRATMKRADLRYNIKGGKYDKSAIRFSVQVGVFKNELTLEKRQSLQKFGTLQFSKNNQSMIRYFIGNFKTIDEANTLLKKLKDNKIDCFVIGRYYDKIITTYKAQEILSY